MSRFDDVETGDGTPAPLIYCDVKTETVIASERDDHPEHPESLRPRVFYTVRRYQIPFTGDVAEVRHYEILQTGYAIPWKTLPKTFEYLHFILESNACVNLVSAGGHKYAKMFWAGTDKTIFEEVG